MLVSTEISPNDRNHPCQSVLVKTSNLTMYDYFVLQGLLRLLCFEARCSLPERAEGLEIVGGRHQGLVARLVACMTTHSLPNT